MIAKLKDPRLPQFIFEWHEGSRKVYRIDIPGRWRDGEYLPDLRRLAARGYCIAEHAETHAQAYGFVQTFCRGYLLALTQHHQGRLQALLPDRIKENDPCPTR